MKTEKLREINTKCTKCLDFDKKLLKAESRIINLCIENAKLKTALNSMGVGNNSWAALQTHGNLENDRTPQLQNAANLLSDNKIYENREIDPMVLNRIDILVGELTRLMEGEPLGNRDKTLVLQQNLTNSASEIYNNTVNLEQPNQQETPTDPLGFEESPIVGMQVVQSGGNEPSRIEVVNQDIDDPNDNTDDVNFLPRGQDDAECDYEDPRTANFLNDRILEMNSPSP